MGSNVTTISADRAAKMDAKLFSTGMKATPPVAKAPRPKGVPASNPFASDLEL